MNRKVLLGMSGGIDSSVAAILLLQQGYEVIGVTFRFLPPETTAIAEQKASSLAKKLGIKHFIHDAQQQFSNQIIDYFATEYLKGKTPFPCTECNRTMKWPLLFELAEQHQCHFVATGHYANITHEDNTHHITQAIDTDKDQSFFLWPLLNMPIERILLPLGPYTKQEVIQIAKKHGFQSHTQQKESTGICFCKGDYRNFLTTWAQHKNITIPQGIFTDENGKFMAHHKGYPYFTVGQRRGFGTQFNQALYVKEIHPEYNQVVLAPHTSLFKHQFTIKNCLFPHKHLATHPQLWVKIRYRKQATPCHILLQDNHTAQIYLNEPLDAIAPGQTAVFYIKNQLIGGGFIF